MLPYLPDEDSDYWDRIDASLVWSQLMPYYPTVRFLVCELPLNNTKKEVNLITGMNEK